MTAAVCQLLEEFEIVFARANLLNKQSQSQDLNAAKIVRPSLEASVVLQRQRTKICIRH